MTRKPEFKLSGYDSLFRLDSSKRIVTLPLSDLHQHPQLGVQIRKDGNFDKLVKSIKQNGLLQAILAFPDPDGGYWIISGRHRCEAVRSLGWAEIPAILDDTMTQETAEIAITDCNLQHTLGTMEKAWTYRIKREAESRQGFRSDLHPEGKKIQASGQEVGGKESERTIQRYIRLTYLVPELQQMADRQDKTALKVRTGAALSYLSESIQKRIAIWIKSYDKIPDMKIAEEWKLLEEDLTEGDVLLWFQQEDKPKGKTVSVSLSYAEVAGAIPAGYGKKQIDSLVRDLLTEWAKKNEVITEDPYPDLKIGEYVESHGAPLPFADLRIGMKVIKDCSTESKHYFRIEQIENIVSPEEGQYIVILQDGTRQRLYINRSYIDRGDVKFYRPAD